VKPDPGVTVPPAQELGRVHFIGIGGAGMSGIARILLARGLPVSGSDAKDSRGLAALRALGAQVHVGHDAAHVAGAQTVVVSSAVRDTNPELAAARRDGLRVLHRSQALAAVMAGRRAVAVAGTHGKTTTTSMLTVALQHCGADPSFAIGGELTEGGANAHDGSGDTFIAEADESDGSFLLYQPLVAIVTNVEPDHLDHYGTAAAVEAAFDAFCDRVAAGGLVIACADDPGARRMAAAVAERRAGEITVRLYGEAADSDVRVVDLDPSGAGWCRGAGRRRSAPSCCGCRAGTTRSMPRRHGRPPPGSGTTARRSLTVCAHSAAPVAGSRPRARPAASGCSTITPITRPRWRRSCAPRAASPAPAGSSPSSSRTCTAAPGSSPRSSAPPSPSRTRSSSWMSTLPARTPSPASAVT
jgi:hypothetical protein